MPAIDASVVSLATDTSFEDGSVSHYMTVRLPNGVFVRAVISPEAARELQRLLAPARPEAPQTQTLVYEGGSLHPQGEEPSATPRWAAPATHAATERPTPIFGVAANQAAAVEEEEEDFESSGFDPDDDGAQAL